MSKIERELIELKKIIEAAEISLQQARKMLVELVGTQEEKMLQAEARKTGAILASDQGQVIEGVFDGQNMVGPDGKKYSVPANYASKSKLVEGDGLKLTITADGSFIYKQINLLERQRLVGVLSLDEATGEYRVLAQGKAYQVLTASVTYFKGEEGDQVTILVPQDKESSWAAVENIFKSGDLTSRLETDKITQEIKAHQPEPESLITHNELQPEKTAPPEKDLTPNQAVPAGNVGQEEFLTSESGVTAAAMEQDQAADVPSVETPPSAPEDIFAAAATDRNKLDDNKLDDLDQDSQNLEEL